MTRARPWALAGSAALVLFALIAADVAAGGALADRDAAVGARVVGLPFAVGIARAMAFIGESELVIAVAIVTGAVLLLTGRRWGALRVVGVVGATYACSSLLKLAVARARPEYAIAHASGFAFPSGHAASAAALAVLLTWFATRNLQGRALVSATLAFAAAWALAMAFTRMVLGVHYLTDVLGGLALGAGVACIGLAASVVVERRWPLSRARP